MAESLDLIKVVRIDNPKVYDTWTRHNWDKLGANKNGWMIAPVENTPPEVLEIKSKNAQAEVEASEVDEVVGVSEVKKTVAKKK